MFMFRRTHETELQLIETRILELKALHRDQVDQVRGAGERDVDRWREQVASQSLALSAARADYTALARELVSLKREGFIPPNAPVVAVADVTLDPTIQTAIAEVSWAPDIREHLERYAWAELEAGRSVADVVARIHQGDVEPSRHHFAAGVELPEESPVRVMTADDLAEGEDEGDED